MENNYSIWHIIDGTWFHLCGIGDSFYTNGKLESINAVTHQLL